MSGCGTQPFAGTAGKNSSRQTPVRDRLPFVARALEGAQTVGILLVELRASDANWRHVMNIERLPKGELPLLPCHAEASTGLPPSFVDRVDGR
jgi:hypothetical protein